MADAASATDEIDEAAAPVPAAPRSKSKLGLIIGLVLVAAAGGGGYFFYTKQSGAPAAGESGEGTAPDAAAKPSGTPAYLALTPSFTVNLDDEEASRYLQVEIEVMARDVSALDNIKLHTPRIRNALLLLLGQQKYHELTTREAKEALQAKVLAEIQNNLKAETGKPGIEAVYFTSFVMQ